jgi:hypothetical protein
VHISVSDEVVPTRHGHAAVRVVPVNAALDRKARRALLAEAASFGRTERRTEPGFPR